MLQILVFTITAILLYVFSDWLLGKMEQIRGKPFAARSMVFLIIILLLSVVTFEGLQKILSSKLPVEAAATEKKTQVPIQTPSPVKVPE